VNEYGAKAAYLDQSVADEYERRRFSGWLGRFVDEREKGIVLRMVGRVVSSLRAEKPRIQKLRILDIPCGTGRMSTLLGEKGAKVVGADISLQMLLKAREKLGSRGDLVLCDAERLPFKDSVFHCVLTVRLTGHVPPKARKRILKEGKRVTERWMLLFYYDPLSLKGIFRRMINLFRRRKEKWNPVSSSKLRAELEEANLAVIELDRLLWKVAETYAVLVVRRHE